MNIAIEALQAQVEGRVHRLQEARPRVSLLKRELMDAQDMVWDLEGDIATLRVAMETLVGAE